MLDPALEACELAAASLDDALAQERDGTNHPRWARGAFLANCFAAARRPLRVSAGGALASYRDALERRADSVVAAMATREADSLLERVGVGEISKLIALYKSGSANDDADSKGSRVRTRLRDDPALSLASVGAALDALVDAVGAADDPAPSFDAVRDPKRRADARRAYASAIIEAFTTAYAALLDPSNGYGDARGAMRHGPNALSTLLGGV
jgi:hypothetical protein